MFENYRLFRFQEYFATEGSGGPAEMTDEEVLNADLEDLNADDSTEDSTEEVAEEETEDAEEVAELADEEDSTETEETEEETEEEVEEDKEEVPEELEPNEKATYADIKAKYPNVFKEFPALAKSFGLSRQYQEHFPTPDDARDAAVALSQFQDIANDLQTGNPVKLLTSLGESNPDAVVEFSRNILPILSKLDEGLFYEATLPVLSHFLKNALSAARNTSDEKYGKNLQMAVQYLSHWAFKDTNVPDFGKKRDTNQPDPERMRLEKERNDYLKERYQESTEDVNNELKSELTKLVGAQLKTIKGQNKYVMTKINNDIIRAVDNEIVKDDNFLRGQHSLWQRAARTNFRDKQIISRIKSAYLERSKPLIPKVAKRVLLQAGLIKNNKPKVKPDTSASGRGVRSTQNNVRNINPKAVDFGKTSDLDILEGRVVNKK